MTNFSMQMVPKNVLWLNFWNRSLIFWTRVKVKIQMNVRPQSNWSKNLSKHTEKPPISYKKAFYADLPKIPKSSFAVKKLIQKCLESFILCKNLLKMNTQNWILVMWFMRNSWPWKITHRCNFSLFFVCVIWICRGNGLATPLVSSVYG